MTPRVVGVSLREYRRSREDAEKRLLAVAEHMWKGLNTPTSLGLYLCARHGDLVSVVSHKIHPKDYLSADEFAADYQAVSFLRKCPLSCITQAERVAAAKKKFFEAEEACRETNHRFRARQRGKLASSPVEQVLFIAQRKIASWLGPGPNPEDWARRCRFGPGADNLTGGPRTGSYHKLSALSSTDDFADGALSLALDHPAWAAWLAFRDDIPDEGYRSVVRIQTVPGNKIVFVPKTAMIERTIAIEPRMNIFAQLGLGALIRSALRNRAGLDLDRQDPNQDLAYEASIYGHLATIDLSAASDTISVELVRDLLPEGWFTALNWCRSKSGTLDDLVIHYQKFSSMGNGYTFELESMIFYALLQGVCGTLGIVNHYNRVYGDDIICPVEAVALLEEVLAYCGFKVNTDKSFSSGVFRESCGKDFFDGTNVRPHLSQEVPTDVETTFSLANGIRLAARRLYRGFGCDNRLRTAWLHAVAGLPRPLRTLLEAGSVSQRLWGVEISAGAGGLILNQDEASASPFFRKARNGWEGYFFGTAIARPWVERDLKHPSLLYLYALYRCKDGLGDGIAPGVVTGRGSVALRFTSKGYSLRWANLGPWL